MVVCGYLIYVIFMYILLKNIAITIQCPTVYQITFQIVTKNKNMLIRLLGRKSTDWLDSYGECQ